MNEKCFALKPDHKCSALNIGDCCGNYEKCPFYKPKWMAERDTSRCLYRISEKPAELQEHIAERYYHGEKPWKRVRDGLLAGTC